jgi:hypothetical protein
MTAQWMPPAPPIDPPTVRLPVQRGPFPAGAPPVLPPPSGRSRRGWWMALAAVLGLVAGAGGVAVLLLGAGHSAAPAPAARPAAPTTFTVTGTLTLTDTSGYGPSILVGAGGCSGSGGYSDIRSGAGITVADATGTIVATGSLGVGRSRSSTICTFAFTISNVPTGSAFYQIEVGHRGAVTYGRDDLRTYGASLTLGS